MKEHVIKNIPYATLVNKVNKIKAKVDSMPIDHHHVPVRLLGGETYELKAGHKYKIMGSNVQVLLDIDGNEIDDDIGTFDYAQIDCADAGISVDTPDSFMAIAFVQSEDLSVIIKSLELGVGTHVKNTSEGDEEPCWIFDEYFEFG